ncbi:gas vesicle protein [Sphaerisporangium melleum]|uniref:Gas vesicle protein n=1 Tax=Sphaerisporangium melleum TaxID=321316 RepID=A0A917RNK9_9ACTN|nr:GvpL/GvpF family gas vesicle protein [Sphaerisporangium melleum]GGL16209.1 gas vesicle protein [Sphaerisporangium melleum]GII70572.1 gas vesicle protein [Sphaerisporangium melleum]
MADTGTYLYAITRAEDLPDRDGPAGLAGVAGTPVRVLTHAGLAAYVSTVPLTEFGEEPLRRSLEDLEWLGETARAHHRVVDAVAGGAAATAPVRLVTVYSGDDQVCELLDRRREDFAEVLTRVTGRQEWGVKAYALPATTPGVPESGGGEEGRSGRGSARPGTDYLRRRRASLRDRDQAWREAAERAESIHSVLARMAVASTRHRPQDPQLSGRRETMVLNGAYLVDDELCEAFASAVDELRGPDVEIELTGPWAPYSFTALDPGGPGDAGDHAPGGAAASGGRAPGRTREHHRW